MTMARRSHTPEQIIRKLREAGRILGEGGEVADIAQHLEIPGRTYSPVALLVHQLRTWTPATSITKRYAHQARRPACTDPRMLQTAIESSSQQDLGRGRSDHFRVTETGWYCLQTIGLA